MQIKTRLLLQVVCTSLILCNCHAAQNLWQTEDDFFPPPPTNLVFNPYRTDAYTASELLTNFDANHPKSYYSTPDWKCYICFTNFLDRNKHGDLDEVTARYMRLHDLSIEESLDSYLLATNNLKQVVGIMGGHDMRRGVLFTVTNSYTGQIATNISPYMQVALLARKLSQEGFTVATGGGPGAMEAGNLGAWFAGYREDQLFDAVRTLADVPKPSDRGQWLKPAFEVMARYNTQHLHAESIGVPTWFYGFEPPNPFATHIAKYFDNSLREEHLLAIANAGVIFTEGGAGTVQEIFQNACQNYYHNYRSKRSAMVLLGVNYWNPGTNVVTDTNSIPTWPVLEKLAEKGMFTNSVMISDNISDIVRFIVENKPQQ